MDGSKTEILIFVRNKEDGKSEVESVRTECEISVNGKIEKVNKLIVVATEDNKWMWILYYRYQYSLYSCP